MKLKIRQWFECYSRTINTEQLPSRDDNPQSLLRAADEALYQAKAAGRNRVMLYVGAATAQGGVADIRPYTRDDGNCGMGT